MFKDAKGFSLLELLVVCSIVAILAGVAVPKIGQVMANARSARIEADLTTLDTAIVMYQNDTGKNPAQVSDLKGYLNDADKLEQPAGSCAMRDGKPEEIPAGTAYTLDYDGEKDAQGNKDTAGEWRAFCKGHKAGDFGR